MLGLPLSLYLTFAPVYLSSMGTGSEFGTNLGYELSKRASVEFNLGVLSATDFKDRNGSLDLDYKLTGWLTTETGFGYDQYDLYSAGSPTITKDLHCRVKVKVF